MAQDRPGRDTSGVLELTHRLVTINIDLKALDISVDAQDVAGRQLAALVTAAVAAIERANVVTKWSIPGGECTRSA